MFAGTPDVTDIGALLQAVDGILLTGARANVHPSRFRQEPHPAHEPYDGGDPVAKPSAREAGPGPARRPRGASSGRASSGVPAGHHEVVRLRMNGFRMAEIAARTGLHEGSVRRILYDLPRASRSPRADGRERPRPNKVAGMQQIPALRPISPTGRTAGSRARSRPWPPPGSAASGSRPRRDRAATPGSTTEAAIRLIYEEVCLRREAGLEVDTDRGRAPVPAVGGRAAGPLRLRPAAPAPRGRRPPSPRSARRSGRSCLLAELGRGASGPDLPRHRPDARRPAGGREGHPRRPGRAPGAGPAAAHAHRPALLRARLPRARASAGLCMPYLGGASLRADPRGPGRRPPRRSGRAGSWSS